MQKNQVVPCWHGPPQFNPCKCAVNDVPDFHGQEGFLRDRRRISTLPFVNGQCAERVRHAPCGKSDRQRGERRVQVELQSGLVDFDWRDGRILKCHNIGGIVRLDVVRQFFGSPLLDLRAEIILPVHDGLGGGSGFPARFRSRGFLFGRGRGWFPVRAGSRDRFFRLLMRAFHGLACGFARALSTSAVAGYK